MYAAVPVAVAVLVLGAGFWPMWVVSALLIGFGHMLYDW